MTQQSLQTTTGQSAKEQQAIQLASKKQFLDQVHDRLEVALQEVKAADFTALPALRRSFAMSITVKQVQEIFTKEVCQTLLLPLMGTALGFRTDRDSDPAGPYPIEVVRDCAVEALVKGYSLYGNEWNIIGRNMYVTKTGAENRVKDWPGMANLRIAVSNPDIVGDVAMCAARASWMLNGTEDSLVCKRLLDGDGVVEFDERLAVRVNANSKVTQDAIKGKATGKLFKLILQRISGIHVPDPDDVIVAHGEEVTERRSAAKEMAKELVARQRDRSEKNRATKSDDPAAGSDGLPEPGADG